jgi:hypothetical protein
MIATVKSAVAALWVVLLIDAIPGVAILGRDNPARMLLLSAAITASVAISVRHCQRPVAEVFEAGREYERRVMLREMNQCKVLPFDRSGT